jgi:hypothetical protein
MPAAQDDSIAQPCKGLEKRKPSQEITGIAIFRLFQEQFGTFI